MSLIVTGGSGFMGNNLLRYLLKKYPNVEIINYSKETYAVNPRSLKDLESNPHYHFIEGDINNMMRFQRVIKDFKPIAIYHLAAETHVDRSFREVENFIDANIKGIFSVLEVLRSEKKSPILVYMGTDEVLGDAPEGTYYAEDAKLQPQNPYSASKASAEMICSCYYHSFKVPVKVARSMNMFGPYQHPEKLIAKIITKSLSNEPFYLYKGSTIRGWTFVEDSCEALDTIRLKGKIGETYHIPAKVYKPVPEVAKSILGIMGKEELLRGFKGERIKDDYRYALDGTKMTYELEWLPQTEWNDGIKKTIDWYKNNKWFWESTVRG